MRRDRGMHRLGLASVERLPADVLIDTCQRLCIALDTPDATALPELVAKLVQATATLPRLERFVADVCEVSTSFPGIACMPLPDPPVPVGGVAGLLLMKDCCHTTSMAKAYLAKFKCISTLVQMKHCFESMPDKVGCGRWCSGGAEPSLAMQTRTLHACPSCYLNGWISWGIWRRLSTCGMPSSTIYGRPRERPTYVSHDYCTP